MRELIRIVQAHMDKYGVSEAEVARRIGAQPQTVNTWRNGEMKRLPQQHYLQALAELTKTPYPTVLSAALLDTGYITSPIDGQSDHVAAMVHLSFLADDVNSAVDDVWEPDDYRDEDAMGAFVAAALELSSTAQYLTRAVQEAVIDAVGGDIGRLRQIKREIRRFNQERSMEKLRLRRAAEAQRVVPAAARQEHDPKEDPEPTE